MLYHEYYTWQCFLSDNVIGHADGYASLIFSWDGLDHSLFDDADHHHTLRQRLEYLKRLITHPGLSIENHWYRLGDATVIDAYLDHGQHMIRGQELGQRIREELAAHYRPLAMSNKVFTVLTLSPVSGKTGLLKSLFTSASAKKSAVWNNLGNQLLTIYKEIESDFPGSNLLSTECAQLLMQSYRFDFQTEQAIDERYDLAEQIITDKPTLNDGCLVMGDNYIKAAIIQNNPSLETDWMLNLASSTCEMHISQMLLPKDTLKTLDDSAEESDTDARTAGKKNRDVTIKGISDAQDYRTYITEHGLCVFDNTWIIVFADNDKDKVVEQCRDFSRWVGANNGLVRSEESIQMHLYRVSQPGIGHHAQFSREDHSASISCMMPFTVFNSGHEQPESLRMSSSYQCIGHSPSTLSVGHEFVVAQTGGGKDTQNGTEVLEVFPFGLDYYICEFGDSYKWIVEGFGGHYTTIDPDEIVINPLPGYADAKEGRLPAQVSLGTVEGLSIILLDQSRELSQAEIAASEKALSSLYKDSEDKTDSPILPDLLNAFNSLDFTNEAQQSAAKVMYNNLYNFLDSSNGKAFQGQDNLQLSKGITGVDLVKIDKKMLKFYLTFVSLRFAQNAFFNLDSISRIVFNELHEPVAIAPKVVERIVRTVNRMGRKEGSQMQLITQGLAEIRAIDPEILSSSPIRTLLARKDSWGDIGGILDMPSKAIDIWSKYEQNIENLHFRQCMRLINGNWNDLFLSFPSFALDITTTKREERITKHKIEKQYTNIFERMVEFQKFKQERERT